VPSFSDPLFASFLVPIFNVPLPQFVLVGLGLSAATMVLLFLIGKVPLHYNLRNLTVRWKTTVMTALAFTLVVSLLTVMLAFVNGMYRLTESSGHPENVLILAQGVTDESFSNLGFSDVGDIENQPGVLREEGRPLCSRETYIVVNQPIPNAPPGRPQRRFLQLRGLDDPTVSGRVHDLRLAAGGEWFSPAGVQAAAAKTEGGAAQPAIQAVIGEGVARVLGSDRTPAERAAARNPTRLDTGDSFTLNNRTWYVVGVMQSSGSSFDSEVWAKRSIIGPMFGKETYSSLVIRTANPADAKKLQKFFSNEYKKAAVQAQVETDYFASLSETNKQFLFAIGFVAIFMALGGVFGVMNTMFAAISQRVKDIGVLQILGFSRRQILISFLFESLAIALIGGTIGCALGSLADGWTANSIVSAGQGGGKSVVLKLTVDAETLGSGLLLAMVMGGIGGLVPAASAMRLKPLDALR
jgi:hypothetical protein